MAEWLKHLSHSFADQAGSWFVGLVLAVLGVFSGRLIEGVKFALNRAELRTKYFEQMAIDISHLAFIIDRLDKVYYRASWIDDEGKSAIAIEYDQVMNRLCQMEYVYLSWLGRYWGRAKVDAFERTMDAVRAADQALIRLNEKPEDEEYLARLKEVACDVVRATGVLLK